ncbi:Non-specific lipid-transfer protein-like protein [Camellia lanceoleosa]|uniref:Non-specific lipid-transfer protein-like protein n=1 Tax=Camellia lanceoleosa TaxID=1840588 RepID=A0ACC0HB97_9ERIC|nr:Non-specific lipid-transfer protein-like protein [Camellia lanceoleosa]
MACQRIQMGAVILAMMAALWAGVAAQSSSSCTNAIISMSSCLNYITGNSLTPSSGCCSQFANVVRSQPQCLCQLLSGGGSTLGININQTRAMALPRACNVQTPPISRCNAASPSPSPSTSPTVTTASPTVKTASPAVSPAGTPEAPNTVPSGTGSKTVPSSQSGSSDASSTRMAISLLFFLLFVASYASTSTIC